MATLDNDAPLIFAGSVEFIRSLTATPAADDEIAGSATP